MVTFHGERLHGRYVLFQTKGKNWMIHRMDPPADPDREPMPEHVEPMLAKAAKLPRDDEHWGFEIKWDGIRALAYCSTAADPAGEPQPRDLTAQYPELRALGRELGLARGDPRRRGRRLRRGRAPELPAPPEPHAPRLGVARSGGACTTRPVVYMIFDVLFLEGHSHDGAALHRAPQRCWRQLELDGAALEDAGLPRGRRQGDARGVAASAASRAWSPSGSTALRARPAHRRLAEDQERQRRRSS